MSEPSQRAAGRSADTDAASPADGAVRRGDAPKGVLHDLNNVLMTIVMHADLLLDEVGPEGPARERIKAIIAAVDRGSALTRKSPAPRAPVAVDADPDASPEPLRQPAVGTILLAEDDTMVRKTIARLLTEAGYAVVQAPSGNAAIRHLSAPGALFDLVVTDMTMPNGTGRDLAEHLWKTSPATRLIFVTGYTDDPLFSDGALLASRGWRVLRKPFRPRVLLTTIGEAMGRTEATPKAG